MDEGLHQAHDPGGVVSIGHVRHDYIHNLQTVNTSYNNWQRSVDSYRRRRMYPFMNEDAAWQRLQDTQREIENSRLMAEGRPGATLQLLRRLATRPLHLAWLAMPPPRDAPLRHDGE